MENSNGSNLKTDEIFQITKADDTPCFEEAFEASGHGRFNRTLTLIMGLSMFGIIVETLGSSYILPAVMCEFDMTTTEKGIFSSSVFIGFITSSHLWGYLADTKGRKGVIQPTLFLTGICSIISSFSSISWLLILLRCLTGFFLAATGGCIFAYVGEMNVNSTRTKAIAMVAFMSSIGLAILPGLAWLILPLNFSFPIFFLNINYSTWRLYIVICTIPNILVGILLFWYPESPKYLYVNGRKEEAIEIIRNMYSVNTSKPKVEFPIKSIKDLAKNKSTNNSMWSQTIPLFKFPLLPPFLLTCFGQFTIFFLSSGFYLWFPAIFNNLKFDDDTTNTVCGAMELNFLSHNSSEILSVCKSELDDQIYIMGMIMGAIFCGFYLMIRFVIDRVGKNLLLIIILTVSAGCTVGLYFATNYYLILVLFVLCLSSGSVGSIITSIAVDLFPTQYRGMAMSLSLMCGRIGAVVGANLSGIMFEKACSYTFVVFGIEVFIFVLSSLLFPKPEKLKEKLSKKGIAFQ